MLLVGFSMVSEHILFGLFVGGATGYKIGISRNISQKQKAKDNATQIQIGGNYGHK